MFCFGWCQIWGDNTLLWSGWVYGVHVYPDNHAQGFFSELQFEGFTPNDMTVLAATILHEMDWQGSHSLTSDHILTAAYQIRSRSDSFVGSWHQQDILSRDSMSEKNSLSLVIAPYCCNLPSCVSECSTFSVPQTIIISNLSLPELYVLVAASRLAERGAQPFNFEVCVYVLLLHGAIKHKSTGIRELKLISFMAALDWCLICDVDYWQLIIWLRFMHIGCLLCLPRACRISANWRFISQRSPGARLPGPGDNADTNPKILDQVMACHHKFPTKLCALYDHLLYFPHALCLAVLKE